MSFLNHLVRRKDLGQTAQRTDLDKKKRIQLWAQHLKNYKERRELSRAFFPPDLKKALPDQATIEATLRGIENTISDEFVISEEEERQAEQVLTDLQELTSEGSGAETHELNRILVEEVQKLEALHKLFAKMCLILQTELQTIRIIRQRPPNLLDFLCGLHNLIWVREFSLYRVFDRNNFGDDKIEAHGKIKKLTQTYLLEEKLEEEIESDESKFVKEMARQMSPVEEGKMRELAETIWAVLLDEAGGPFRTADEWETGVKKFERLILVDDLMFRIIKKQRPKWPHERIVIAIKAFRKAHSEGHFDDMSTYT